MIIINENHTELEFGSGDICVTGGHVINASGQVVGIATFSGQQGREIGKVGDIKAGQVYDLKEFPVLMTFAKPESIDVVIRALHLAKEEMGSMKPEIVTEIETCNSCDREYDPHVTGGIVNGHLFCQDCIIGMAEESAKLSNQMTVAVEMLEAFAFIDPDESEKERLENAANVQKFLRSVGHGQWVDDQIAENEKDMEKFNLAREFVSNTR